jgi:flagellar biosynthesis regulator FlaF
MQRGKQKKEEVQAKLVSVAHFLANESEERKKKEQKPRRECETLFEIFEERVLASTLSNDPIQVDE